MKSLALGLALCSVCAWGQPVAVDPKLSFDAASIKPAPGPTPGQPFRIGPNTGGPGSKDPGRIRYPFTTLRNLLMVAYDVKSFQIEGPAQLDSERFELQATMSPETTKEQFRMMMQNLLAERFLVKLHHDTKDLPKYSLVVGKKGLKLKESGPQPDKAETENSAPPPFPTGPPKMGPDGFPVLPAPNGGRGGISMMMMPNRARLQGQWATMEDLALRLSGMLDKPVTDETGLKAKYDFTLTYSPEGLGGMRMGPGGGGRGGGAGMVMIAPPGGGGPEPGKGPDSGPDAEAPQDLFSAIQSQLGLKLDQKKGSVDVLVIDHIEKAPTEN